MVDLVGAIAEAAAKLDGVNKVRVADNAAYAHLLAEPTAALIAQLADDYSHVLACASTTGKNVMPRVAALKDVAQISDILAVESADNSDPGRPRSPPLDDFHTTTTGDGKNKPGRLDPVVLGSSRAVEGESEGIGRSRDLAAGMPGDRN